jgi:hypothetical protein
MSKSNPCTVYLSIIYTALMYSNKKRFHKTEKYFILHRYWKISPPESVNVHTSRSFKYLSKTDYEKVVTAKYKQCTNDIVVLTKRCFETIKFNVGIKILS